MLIEFIYTPNKNFVMNIDEIAQRIVSDFNAENDEMLKVDTKEMLHKMKHYESMFSVVKHPYLVAKSLYFMLTEDYLSVDDQMSAVKLAYFCLLNNYLKNGDKQTIDPEFEDLVSGCKLALVLISMQNQYLMYSVIAGLAGYINPETHIRNQIFLFGGIVKEAECSHSISSLEEVVNKYFAGIYKELSSHLPTGRDLAELKENCTSVIKSIKTSISVNLKEFEDSMW